MLYARNCWMSSDNRFDYDIVNSLLELLNIMPHLCDSFESGCQCPFVSFVAIYLGSRLPYKD